MSELDKTIEDLEAEVAAELEEGMHDAPKKGAVAPEKGSKVDGDVEDLGAPVVKGDEKKGPDAAKKTKKDTTIPTAVKGDEAPQKLKENFLADMRGLMGQSQIKNCLDFCLCHLTLQKLKIFIA